MVDPIFRLTHMIQWWRMAARWYRESPLQKNPAHSCTFHPALKSDSLKSYATFHPILPNFRRSLLSLLNLRVQTCFLRIRNVPKKKGPRKHVWNVESAALLSRHFCPPGPLHGRRQGHTSEAGSFHGSLSWVDSVPNWDPLGWTAEASALQLPTSIKIRIRDLRIGPRLHWRLLRLPWKPHWRHWHLRTWKGKSCPNPMTCCKGGDFVFDDSWFNYVFLRFLMPVIKTPATTDPGPSAVWYSVSAPQVARSPPGKLPAICCCFVRHIMKPPWK